MLNKWFGHKILSSPFLITASSLMYVTSYSMCALPQESRKLHCLLPLVSLQGRGASSATTLRILP